MRLSRKELTQRLHETEVSLDLSAEILRKVEAERDMLKKRPWVAGLEQHRARLAEAEAARDHAENQYTEAVALGAEMRERLEALEGAARELLKPFSDQLRARITLAAALTQEHTAGGVMSLTDLQLDAIERRHVKVEAAVGVAPCDVCDYCESAWPCEEISLLSQLREARAERDLACAGLAMAIDHHETADRRAEDAERLIPYVERPPRIYTEPEEQA